MQNGADLRGPQGYQTPEAVLAEARSDALAPEAIIILTLNEEANIGVCLKSVCGWARQVFVLDSFSTDDTVTIARRFEFQVVQNAYSAEFAQRNWALDNLPFETEWIFYLDADEWMTTELKEEIGAVIRANPPENSPSVGASSGWEQLGAAKHASLARASACVLPSYSEGLPIAVLKAWAHSLPVIMTSECNLPEGFIAGAAVQTTQDPMDLAEAIRHLMRLLPSEASAMGRAGRDLVASRYSWPCVADQMRSEERRVGKYGTGPGA